MLFDWLVTGGILASNPATSVRGPKHVIKRGKTPVLTTDQARAGSRTLKAKQSAYLTDFPRALPVRCREHGKRNWERCLGVAYDPLGAAANSRSRSLRPRKRR